MKVIIRLIILLLFVPFVSGTQIVESMERSKVYIDTVTDSRVDFFQNDYVSNIIINGKNNLGIVEVRVNIYIFNPTNDSNIDNVYKFFNVKIYDSYQSDIDNIYVLGLRFKVNKSEVDYNQKVVLSKYNTTLNIWEDYDAKLDVSNLEGDYLYYTSKPLGFSDFAIRIVNQEYEVIEPNSNSNIEVVEETKVSGLLHYFGIKEADIGLYTVFLVIAILLIITISSSTKGR